MVRLLIEHGADVSAHDKNHSTPLHLASSSLENAETVRFLLEHGADATPLNEAHKTPLHLVASWVSP